VVVLASGAISKWAVVREKHEKLIGNPVMTSTFVLRSSKSSILGARWAISETWKVTLYLE
jgi:hypothetical protein